MNDDKLHNTDPSSFSNDDLTTIADQNIERLLTSSYAPESPDADFAARVTASVREAVRQRTRPELSGRCASRSAPAAGRSSRWSTLAIRLASLAALILAVLLAFQAFPTHDPFYRDGDLVWIDGRAYTPAESRTGSGLGPAPARRVRGDVSELMRQVSTRGLTPRPLTVAPEAVRIAVGDVVRTGATERRRLALPDGSVLYVNARTVARLQDARRVVIDSGEVFVEVAPAFDETTREKFVVETPVRHVTALGTRFAVRVARESTEVLVTQGKVAVEGAEAPVQAGQQWTLRGDDASISPAPRASHALDWTRELAAAAQSPLVPKSDHGGGALVVVDPNGQDRKLSLRTYHVDVHIEDGFARTTIDQTFFNDTTSRQEGTFYFPLPPDGSLSRLAMYVNGKLMEGGMAERDYARQVFETIKYRALDPALLEWVDGSTFKMRVFPLEPREEKRIVLSYTQRLPELLGQLRYHFPAGHNMAVVRDWSAQIRVRHGADWRHESVSHEFAVSHQKHDLLLNAEAKGIKPDRDLLLELTPPYGGHRPPGARFSTSEPNSGEFGYEDRAARFSTAVHEGRSYLMVRYQPDLPRQMVRERRDWVFLFDASGDRDPLLARAQIEIIRTMLENAEHDDTFAVLTAGTRIHVWSSDRRPATPGNVADAVAFLEQTHLVGALDVERAFAAAEPFVRSSENAVIVHVGTAVPILGERADEKLAAMLPDNARYVGVGVGKQWNRALMKLAASRTGGYYTQMNPDEDIRWRAFDLLAILNTPRLLDVRVKADDGEATFLLFDDFVAHDESLCAVARLDSGAPLPRSLTVEGRYRGEPYVQVLPVVDVASDAGYLPRMWAKLELDRLSTVGLLENKQQIVELSKSMYVMSPFTSLLVLENDEMYTQYNVDRGRKDHWAMYPCPEQIDVVREPLPGPVADGSGTRKSSAEGSTAEPSSATSQLPGLLPTILVRVPTPVLYVPDRSYRSAHVATAWQWLTGGTLPPASDRVQVQRAMAELAQTFNSLIEERRYEEAQGVAMQAQVLDARSELAQTLIWKSRFIRRVLELHQARDAKQGGFSRTMNAVQRSDIPFADGRVLFGEASQFGISTRSRRRLNRDGAVFDHLGNSIRSTIRTDSWDAPGGPNAWGRIPPDLRSTSRIDHPWFSLRDERSRNESVPSLSEFGTETISTTYSVLFGVGYDFSVGLPVRGAHGLTPTAESLHGNPIGWRSSHLQWNDGWWTTDSGSLLNMSGNELGMDNGRVWNYPIQMPRSHAWDNDFDGIHGAIRETGSTTSTDAANTRDSLRQSLLAGLAARIQHGGASHPSTYRRPQFTGEMRIFADLLAFAPGMNTLLEDVQAVVVAEHAAGEPPTVGEVDSAARQLIERARPAAWQSATYTMPDGSKVSIQFDGRGRLRCERRTIDGLKEIIVCDGQTLWHLYPELGVGAKRPLNRAYRSLLSDLVPWLVPPVEDLAVGADIRLLDNQTVSIVPHAGSTHVHLLFDKGRLSESRMLDGDTDQVLARVVFDTGGTVRLLDGDGNLLAQREMTRRPAAPATLQFDPAPFVILPMPLRHRESVLSTAPRQANGSLQPFAEWDEDDALRLVAADLCMQQPEMQQVIAERFFARGDRRIGFYTLMLSAYSHWDRKSSWQTDQGHVVFDPSKDHPNDPLGGYVSIQLDVMQHGTSQDVPKLTGVDEGFIQQLAEFQRQYIGWSTGRARKGSNEEVQAATDELLALIDTCHSPRFAWVLLPYANPRGDAQGYQRLARSYERLARSGPVQAFAQFEQARALYHTGNAERAQQIWQRAMEAAIQAGVLPWLDHDVRNAFQHTSDGQLRWNSLIGKAAQSFIDAGRRPTAIALAWQLRQVGDPQRAEEVLGLALSAVPDDDRLAVTLAAVDYLWHNGEQARALAILEPLLEDAEYQPLTELWRLAAVLAERQGRLAESLRYEEQALDREYARLPDRVNLEVIRSRYGEVLNRYQRLATAIATLEQRPSQELLQRVVRMADRWRSLDDDPAAACPSAARIFTTLGADDLAWDYLTTPLAHRPNEAQPWIALATTLASQNDFEMADRAYAAAFQAEGSNAQILWDHAKLLERHGRFDRARSLYQQIADSEWQPRFQSLRQQAQRILGPQSASVDE